MLKIEIVKFEAQDVITASVPCACVTMAQGKCDPDADGMHWIGYDAETKQNIYCNAGEHTCGH